MAFLPSTPSLSWTLLRRISLRHWRFAPKQSLLLIALFSLGVAVFVSVRLANRAAVASFSNFTDTLTGQSDWTIQPAAGTLPEGVLGELRSALGARPINIIPVVEASAARARPANEADDRKASLPEHFTLLGVDVVSLSNIARGPSSTRPLFRNSSERPSDQSEDRFWSTFRQGPQLWVTAAVAAKAGTTLDLIVNESIVSLPIAGTIPATGETLRMPDNLVVLDLPRLQALTGKVGHLDRVEFVVESGPKTIERGKELQETLEKLSLGRWIVQTPGARRETAETMTRAFRLNLTVLSLIALLVGLYLIFQTLDGAVIRRRAEIAILRSLGVEDGTIRRLWLAEAIVLGLAGGVGGILLGWAGAQGSVRAIGQTVNVLYFATTVKSAGLSWNEAAITLALSICVSLVAGWWPARQAAAVPPAQLLIRHAAPARPRHRTRHALQGAAWVLLGVVLAKLPPLRFEGGGRFPLAGYAAAFFWVFGGGLVCPILLPWFSRAGSGLGQRFASARMALSQLKIPSTRHHFAVAGLLCAFGMAAGMIILVASFEKSVRAWVQQSLQADLYLSSKGAQTTSSRNRISPETVRAISTRPAVAQANAVVAYPIEIDGISTVLSGVDLQIVPSRSNLPWVSAPHGDAIFDATRNEALALASESFCERFRTRVGDAINVPTPTGVRGVTIVGIFSDYGNERGLLMVDRAHLRRWYEDDYVTSLSLYLKPNVNHDHVRAELLEKFPGLTIYSNSALRAEVLRIFRQTFSITYALELIGLAVAVGGLAMTLASVLIDRRDELTTLRALGFSRRELATTTSLEGVAVALAGVVGGMLLSLALGWLLIYVINKQSFGWTLGFALPIGQLAGLAVAVIATGWAAAYGVGFWGAALPADQEE